MSKERRKCVFLNNQPCLARPTPININSNEPLYYLFTVTVNDNKCGGRFNTIDGHMDDLYIANKKYLLE